MVMVDVAGGGIEVTASAVTVAAGRIVIDRC